MKQRYCLNILRLALVSGIAVMWGCTTQAAPPAGDPVSKAEFIFEAAPFPSCHASTIAEVKDGLVAAWFGGTRERAPDVEIWVSRQPKAGGAWSAPRSVAEGVQADGSRLPCWNPVLFQAPNGPLMLFYKVGPSPSGWWGMLKTSKDGGSTWSEARRLPQGILGPIKNKPVLVADGSLLCPSSVEGQKEPPSWRVHFERTVDWGDTWSTVEAAVDPKSAINAIQPSVLFHAGGRLEAVGRTNEGHIFQTWSSDEGRTWSPLELTELPNPNSGIDAVTLRDGRQLLVYNHCGEAKGRSPLNVAISKDGKTWQAALVLEHEHGEYSYPAVIQAADGSVHVTYTWKRRRIRHVVIAPDLLEPRDTAGGRWPDGVEVVPAAK